jgi:hypothetical protein
MKDDCMFSTQSRHAVRQPALKAFRAGGLAAAVFLAAWSAAAGEEPPPGQAWFEDGLVKASLTEKWVKFPAEAVLDGGEDVIEFVAYFHGGVDKGYESIFIAKCEPKSVNLALVAMGLREAGDQAVGKRDPRAPHGDEVIIEVEYKDKDGVMRRRPAEDFLIDSKSRRPMKRINWIYTGGQYMEAIDDKGNKQLRWTGNEERLFAATLWGNPGALLQNPDDKAVDPRSAQGDAVGESYRPNPEVMPRRGTAVTIIVTVLPTREDAQVVARVGRRLRGPSEADRVEMDRLIKLLDDDEFKKREAATRELAERYGGHREVLLEAARAPARPAEARKRLEAILYQSEDHIDRLIAAQELLKDARYLARIAGKVDGEERAAVVRTLKALTGKDLDATAWAKWADEPPAPKPEGEGKK